MTESVESGTLTRTENLLDHLRNLKLGEMLEVCSPFGWDIKVIKIKWVS